MYKDKDKQREANRERQRRYKAKSKALAKGVTSEGVTQGVTITGETITLEGKPRRGKAIKCFYDLPPDVQQTISRMSLVDGKIDQFDKAKRTKAAIKYQHAFPDRYEPNHITEVVNVVV